MKIAANEEVQRLKAENKLDGLNMSEILKLVGMRVNIRGDNNENAPRQPQEYIPKGYGHFEFEKCRSTKEFKAEYKILTAKVSDLEAALHTLKNKSA